MFFNLTQFGFTDGIVVLTRNFQFHGICCHIPSDALPDTRHQVFRCRREQQSATVVVGGPVNSHTNGVVRVQNTKVNLHTSVTDMYFVHSCATTEDLFDVA